MPTPQGRQDAQTGAGHAIPPFKRELPERGGLRVPADRNSLKPVIADETEGEARDDLLELGPTEAVASTAGEGFIAIRPGERSDGIR